MHHEEHEEILDDFAADVKAIENEAEEILKEAARKKDEIISGANTEASAMVSKNQAELEKKKDEKIKKQKEKINEEKEDIMKSGQKEIDSFQKSGKNNMPKAAEIILKKLDSYIGEL